MQLQIISLRPKLNGRYVINCAVKSSSSCNYLLHVKRKGELLLCSEALQNHLLLQEVQSGEVFAPGLVHLHER